MREEFGDERLARVQCLGFTLDDALTQRLMTPRPGDRSRRLESAEELRVDTDVA